MVEMIGTVALGGFLGAISRYWLMQYIKTKIKSVMPIATLVINLTGSFLLGLTAGFHVNETVHLLFAVGFLGAYTTFSTLAVEAAELWKGKTRRTFYCYLFFSFGGGLLFACLGYLAANIG
ncbi:fluoride efflux transporter FluC [Niallia taxi]|uniref:fluoride efflux transporter FluC n=1 Tax=Niallia taxi TaxID=2499688 RepID=UPI00300974F9